MGRLKIKVDALGTALSAIAIDTKILIPMASTQATLKSSIDSEWGYCGA